MAPMIRHPGGDTPLGRTMAYRVTVEHNGEEYWYDISNDLRSAAVNQALTEGSDLQEALQEIVSGEIVSVEEQ